MLLFCSISCDFAARRYVDIVRDVSKVFDVEPALIYAIAEIESRFNPSAVSPVGAVGIMQIMPATGEWIAARLEMAAYREEDLFDPEINFRFGAYYLSYLATCFAERWHIIAAYNAGEGAVKAWLSEGITRESIPYPETAAYLRKVERAFSHYQGKKYCAFD